MLLIRPAVLIMAMSKVDTKSLKRRLSTYLDIDSSDRSTHHIQPKHLLIADWSGHQDYHLEVSDGSSSPTHSLVPPFHRGR